MFTLSKKPCGKRKNLSTDNTKIGIKVDNSYWRNEEVFEWKTHIKEQMENATHGDLCKSEESEYMWTDRKDGTMWQFWGRREGMEVRNKGSYLRLIPELWVEDKVNW